MLPYPPSPAVSDCDSLASDELDTLLDAQGELSHLPTPPLTGDETGEKDSFRSCLSEESDYLHVSLLFLEETRASLPDLETIRTILFRAQLPPEVLALAFNIITELNRISPSLLISSSKGILLTATLNLSALYSNDHPPKLVEWSKLVCDCRWSAAEIDQMGLQILTILDWGLHKFSSPDVIHRAMDRLCHPAGEESRQFVAAPETNSNGDGCKPGLGLSSESPTQLKVNCEDGAAFWMNGQLTPESTPTETRSDCVWSSSRVSSR